MSDLALLSESHKICTKCGLNKSSLEFSPRGKGARKECRQCVTDRTTAWKKANPIKNKRSIKNSQLKKKYGISLEDYESMYDLQAGKCAICCKHKSILCVDHDHKTGKIRGLLCISCNIILARFGDDVDGVMRFIEYLEGS